MYALIKTEHVGCPNPLCSNPGDNLISENCKAILKKEFNLDCACEIAYDRLSEEAIAEINRCDFAIYSCLTPTNRSIERYLARMLSRIRVPIIPASVSFLLPPELGSEGFVGYRYTPENRAIIARLFDGLSCIPTRDYLGERILKNNGFAHAQTVGDWALFRGGNLVRDMRAPAEIRTLVFTMGHYHSLYLAQAKGIMRYLRRRFPHARVIFSTHCETPHPVVLRVARELDFHVEYTAYACASLEFYSACDLHLGYRLHGHVKALSCGVPSILLAEDSRGWGFSCTLDNVGVFPAFCDATLPPSGGRWKRGKSAIARPAEALIAQIEQHLARCFASEFLPYRGVADKIELLYRQRLLPYLQAAIGSRQ